MDFILRSALLLLTVVGFFYFRRPHQPIVAHACDPFSQPGALFLNLENITSTVWKPFDVTCPTSHLLPIVQSILASPAINTRMALPWLADKTMVLIGDSIERFSVDYFCDLMEGELTLIDLNHTLSPPPFTNGRDELRENEEIMKTWLADGRPHWCKVNKDGLNLNLFSFFMYGAANYQEFEQQAAVFGRPHYFAPVEMKERVDHWTMGVLEKAGLTADAVQFSSCLWDIMHFSEIDGAAASSEDVVHAPFPNSERLEWYRQRLSEGLNKIEDTFPQATLIWRRGHDVSCGQFHVPCARNRQLNSVADHVISRRTKWNIDETGNMIRGHSEFFKDRVHPGESFRTLWADGTLFRLREAHYSKILA